MFAMTPEQHMISNLEKTVNHNLSVTSKQFKMTKIELVEQQMRFKKFNNFTKKNE